MRAGAAILALMALIAMSSPTFAQEGLKAGDVIRGQLRLVKTRHPNGTPILAYQIVSDAPKELAEPDDFCDGAPKIFHLVANDKKLRRGLDKKMNKKIAVYADYFFCSHTAWHIGDAVVTMWRFAD